jgi:N-acetylglucosamine kinase-like BadF-type ATPase
VSGELAAVLAVDGGNSKTDLALVAADGTPLVTVRGPGMSGAASLPQTLGLLAGLIDRARPGPGRPVARHLSACVANADLPEEEEQLAAALRAQGWTRTTAVFNDTFAVLRAGLDPAVVQAAEPPAGPAARVPWGVAVTCGAGINCVGVAPDGRATRFLALGEITGDWGGGAGLGRAALWWAIRAEDGRGEATSLREAVAAHFGVPAVSDVAVGLHRHTIEEEALAGLAPVVLAAAAAGDEIAGALVRRQAAEICVMALTAMRRLGLDAQPVPVVLGGGVLAARDPLLLRLVREGIAARAPQAIVTLTDVPPIAGAALLGLDHQGCGPAAGRTLRAAYAPTPGMTDCN